MPEISTRLPCPVCLGATLRKVEIGEQRELVLDYCARCGGIWFERGEVQSMRRRSSRTLRTRIPQRTGPSRMSCHSCHAIIDRNAPTCSTCGWMNRLDCPSCGRPMKTEMHEGVRLDVCGDCHGVWFDHEELESIWRLNVDAAIARRRTGAVDGGSVLLEALAYSPDLVFYGAYAAGHAVSGAAQLAAEAPQVAVAVVEGAGEAAEGIFAAIVEMIGGLFDGL